MAAQADPPLKFAWVERGNPLAQNPDTSLVRRSFRDLEFRVAIDQFLTDTAREADIILPAKSMFEQTDIIGAYWHPYLQLRPRVMDPPGEVLPETEIYRRLATHLDLIVDDVIPGPDDQSHRRWLMERIAPLGLTLADFHAGPVLVPGQEDVVFEDGFYPTPSGKIELLSEEAHGRWGVDVLPLARLPMETAAADGPPPEFPLQLLTPNTKNRIHSQFGNLQAMRILADPPELQINPRDAAERDLEFGDLVRVFNERGSFTVAVRPDGGIRRGCVSVNNGWWSEECGPVNLTSLGRETDMAFGSAFHDNLVEVEKAQGDRP